MIEAVLVLVVVLVVGVGPDLLDTALHLLHEHKAG